jgi:hypothetical protein
LHDGEAGAVGREAAVLVERAARPREAAVDREAQRGGAGAGGRALVEHHGDVGVEGVLDRHRAFGS